MAGNAAVQAAIERARMAATQGPVENLPSLGSLTSAPNGVQAAIDRARRNQMTHEEPAAPSRTGGQGAGVGRQFTGGLNRGIASMVGAPVDLAAWALRQPVAGFESLTGIDTGLMPGLERPVLGSARNTAAMEGVGFIPEDAPDTGLERLVARMGEEVGGGAVMGAPIARLMQGLGGPLGNAGREAVESFRRFAATDAASDAAAGAAGDIAEQVMPDSPTAQLLAQLLAGGSTAAAIDVTRAPMTAPSLDDLRARQTDAYSTVEGSPVTVTTSSVDDLLNNVERRLLDENMDGVLHPSASRVAEIMRDRAGRPASITDIDAMRRIWRDNVSASNVPSESRLGQLAVDEIDNYLNSLNPGQLSGGSAEDIETALGALNTGRDATRRIRGAEQLDAATDRAARQAATSGTGGNMVNTNRQRINAILNNPKQRRGYRPEEVDEMNRVVRGSRTENLARLLGRLSPTSGALPLMGGIAATAASPAMAAIPAIGYLARGVGERMTDRNIKKLSATVRGGTPTNSSLQAILASLLAQQGTQQ